MHSSREDQPGNAAGQFQTNVYTKKRRKLKITRTIGGGDIAAARTNDAAMGPLLSVGDAPGPCDSRKTCTAAAEAAAMSLRLCRG